MKHESERDDSMDGLLRSAFRTSAPAAPELCATPEVIAAWTEGKLSRAEETRVELHLSRCAACQQMLAVMARTEPVQAALPSVWDRWRLRVIAPVAAAATAVAIWVAAPGDRPEQILREQGKQTVAPGAEQEPSPPSGLAAQPPLEKQRTDDPAGETTDPGRVRPGRSDRAAAELDSLEAEQLADTTLRDRAGESARSAPAAPAAAPPPAAPEAAAQERREAAATLQRAPAPPVVIVSPDPSNRWRIGPGGSVDRSTTGGQSWESTNIEGGNPLTAGSSPAPLVSWLVGPRATVLRTVDGSTFERVAFPESVDLVAVRAESAAVAVVTAANGRRFRTENGGQSWSVVRP